MSTAVATTGSLFDINMILSNVSLLPTTRRLFDPFKEPEKIRENARAEYVQTREMSNADADRNFRVERSARERNGGTFAPMVGSTAPEGSFSLASLKPVALR